MKHGLTELVFILDRSGSMSDLVSDTIGGFNSMIKQQKENDGEIFVTTVLFNSFTYMLHDHVNIQNIPIMTYADCQAYGMTALNDAVGSTIDNIGRRLYETPEDERPEKVIFVIITDGFENASRTYSRKKVKEMIEHQQDKYSWTFMFIGANMDAVKEGNTLGIKSTYSKSYTATPDGTESVFRSVGNVTTSIMAMSTTEYSSLSDENSMASKSVACSLDLIK